MAATNFTPISLYYSTTASAVPVNTNLVAGELALNTVDEKLYFKNSAGTVKLLASNAASSGTVSSVAASVPAFLSIAGSPITTSGTLAITYSGTALPVANGGTGLTTTPANGALDIGNGTGFTRTTITAGTGITVTNASGAITIASSGSVSAATPTALGTVYGKVDTGYLNYSIGQYALRYTTTGAFNVALGQQALGTNISGSRNSAVGNDALSLNTASDNTAIGNGALQANSTASYNTAVGSSALYSNTTAGGNTAVGYQALKGNTTGDQNVAVGYNALGANTVATDNVAIGYDAAKGQVNGGYNVALGTRALEINSNGDNNIAIGYQAVKNSTSARRNICLGQNSAPTITSGSYNTIIGADADTSSSTAQYQIAIGDNAFGKGNNTAFIGGTSGAYNGGNTTTWTTTSDQRIKKNIVNVENALSVITALRPVEFDYKEDNKHEVGFIAQEYQTVLPDQIIKHAANKAEKEMVDGDEVFGIQQNLVPYLVKALQELNAKFDAYVATHP
jgi:hypothetical protein